MSPEIIGNLSTGIVLAIVVLIVIYQKFKPIFHQDRFFVTIINPGKKMERHFIAPKPGDSGVVGFFFKNDRTGYQVDSTCVINGQFNTPTLLYLKGLAPPLRINDTGKLEFSKVVSAQDFYEATQNNIASDLMKSIGKPANMLMVVIIIAVVVIGGALYVNFQTKKELKKTQETLITQIEKSTGTGSPFDARSSR